MHSWQGRQRNCERHSVCHKNIWTQQLPQRSKLGTDAILLYHLNPLKHLKIKVSQDIESTTMAPEEVAAEEEDLDRPQISRRRKLPPPPPVPPAPKAAPKAPMAAPSSSSAPLPSATRPGLRLAPPTLRLLGGMGDAVQLVQARAQQAQQVQAQQAARQAEATAAMERERAGQRLLQAFAAAPNAGYNWRDSSTWQDGVIRIHMAHWELSEEHWTQWLQWMQNEWTRRSAEYTWAISTMDLSHNVLTPPAIEKICDFLDGKLVAECKTFIRLF